MVRWGVLFSIAWLAAQEKILEIMSKGWEGWEGEKGSENMKGLVKLTKGYGGVDLRVSTPFGVYFISVSHQTFAFRLCVWKQR